MLEMITIALAPVPVDFDQLPNGSPPAVSWYSDGSLHHGDATLPLGGRSVSGFIQLKGGYVARVRGDEAPDDALILLRDGTEKVLAEAPGSAAEIFGPAVSADGRRMAWSVVSGLGGAAPRGGASSTLVVARTSTGKVLARKAVHDDLWVEGFVGGTVVLNRGLDSGVVGWHPGRGTLTEWQHADEVTALSARKRLAAVTDGSGCTVVRVVGKKQRLWKTCDRSVVSFSPDGRYAVTKQDLDNGVMVGLRKARSGEQVLRLRTGGGTPEAAWEPGGKLLLTAWDDARMAIVRCTVKGSCEFARPPRSTAGGWPYLLPDQ